METLRKQGDGQGKAQPIQKEVNLTESTSANKIKEDK